VVLPILFIASSCCFFKVDANIPDTTRATVSELRTEAGFRVKQIKQSYSQASAEYQKAALLYTAAEAKYNGWIDEMASVLGECKNFNTRQQYTELLGEAAKRTREFMDYCDGLPKKAALAPVSPVEFSKVLADIGLSFWETGRKARLEKIDAMKKDLEAYKWQDFDKIV